MTVPKKKHTEKLCLSTVTAVSLRIFSLLQAALIPASVICLEIPMDNNSVNEVTQQYLDWEAGSATAKDCAADSLGILWTLVSAVKATP